MDGVLGYSWLVDGFSVVDSVEVEGVSGELVVWYSWKE